MREFAVKERRNPNIQYPISNIQSSFENLRFALRNDVAIEDFGERSLVLLCDALRLREINGASRQILARLDGERTVRDIAGDVGMAAEVVGAALLEMERQGIVRRRAEWAKERPINMGKTKYLAHPEVSFRQEDNDGAILYNAETDALEIVNPVAAEIWRYLAAPRTRAEVVAHLCETCEGAVRDRVEKDVAEFVESLRGKGFIGMVEDPA